MKDINQMKKTLILAFAVGCLAGGWAFGAEKFDVCLPEAARPDILSAVETAAKKPHPRLFADEAGFAALKERIATDEYVKMGADYVRASANRLLKTPPVERTFIGRRLLTVSREALSRISVLAMAWRLFGEKAHFDRAVAELRAVCAFEDWNPSHFLDTAEMSLAVATGYDWLYDDLDVATRREIASALRRFALEASRLPNKKSNWWVKAGNNWNQVCHTGILAAALALAEENPSEAARFVQRTIDCLPIAMKAYAPNGNFPEGPSYWGYATDFNVIAIQLLDSALGNDFGLSETEGFRGTAYYPDFVTGPSGKTFNYADGGSGRGSDMATWWFARRFNIPEIVPYYEAAAYRRFCGGKPGEKRSTIFVLGLFAVHAPAAGTTLDGLPRIWNGGGTAPVAMMRSSWDDEKALFVGLKGGTPGTNHGHMDCGSFVLDTKGVRWAVDLGGESYTKIEQLGMGLWDMRQDSDRWKIYRLNASSHNLLTLDGSVQQSVKGFGEVVETSEAPDGSALRATLDLSTLYTNATKVVRRGILASDGSRFELQDVVRGLRPEAPIRWAMVTQARVEAQPDGSVLLHQNGQSMRLRQTGAQTAPWLIVPAKGPNTWDSENKASQITFTVAMPAEGDARLAVVFEPQR